MSTEALQATGALLLCRAAPDSVAPVAPLLRERMLLTRAGGDWSVLVPEGSPWLRGGEPVDRVLTGWATALAVGAPWPVLALWWDPDRAGCALACGFRRPVGYDWLANGTPAGEDEAMRTLTARLGLDPVADLPALDRLTSPDPAVDATARLRGLLALLTRAGVAPPPGLTPGAPTGRLLDAARARPDARTIDWPRRRETAPGVVSGGSRLIPYLPRPGDPGARTVALAQVAAGLPVTAWGVRRHRPGWTTAGLLLLAHGALGLAYDLTHPRD
ncbi:hypothetical protein [Streptomyces chromofuscus]|uniref:Uncharacterized protein n=1 Tax=Streptomyces chromofuscus TaxID=42881 RepID=A0A7M2T2H7_STRCW|nr:hypothetical protein [Streptomyces chromofuscus]QOV42897.1 hypothetical protein IPT68_24325 [Streptomyces chromofuscus]GGS91899.1 hypothetical protein GCM10010254_09770 [Streptomyces chromofuscus]